MTRDEAIKIVFQHGPGGPLKAQCEVWIELFERLGMLKLDEPKSAYKRAYELLDNAGYHCSQILELLTANGLKIVEK
jgi:hypothetical protein